MLQMQATHLCHFKLLYILNIVNSVNTCVRGEWYAEDIFKIESACRNIWWWMENM